MNIIPGKPIAVATLSQDTSRSIRKIIIPLQKQQGWKKREIWRSYHYKPGDPFWIITDVSFPLKNKIGTVKKLSLHEKQDAITTLLRYPE